MAKRSTLLDSATRKTQRSVASTYALQYQWRDMYSVTASSHRRRNIAVERDIELKRGKTCI